MVRGAGQLSPTDQARTFRLALQLEGVSSGTEIPRDLWDDIIIACFNVASHVSVSTKTRVGEALRLWRVTPGHGKKGGGYVTLLELAERPAGIDEAVAVVD